MAKQTINIGSAANDGTGSTLRESFDITNDNFTELYGGTGGLFHKIEGTNFTGSLLIGHTTTGTLSSASNNTGVGIGTLDALTSGDDNVAVGTGAAGLLAVGSSNVAIGHVALASETGGSRNVAIGQGALNALAHGGQAYNVAVGYQAGVAVSSGVQNTLVGGQAGESLTTGSFNIAIGKSALNTEDTGSGNVGIGRNALNSANYDGSAYNLAVGYNSGYSISTGVQNVILGSLSGDALTTGSNNIVIGYDAAASAVDISNEVTIGNSSIANVRIPSDSTLKIGASGDLQLEHLSGHSYIKNTDAGDLYIENQVDDASIIFRCDDGSGGLDTYFSIVGAGNRVQYNKDLRLIDSVELSLGSSDDLKIYHNGSTNNSNVDNNTGDLYFSQYNNDGDIIFRSDDGSGGIAQYFRVDGGEVETRFLKSTLHFDNVSAKFGDSGDFQIVHDSSNTKIVNITGDLKIGVSNTLAIQNNAYDENIASFTKNGNVSLYYDNSKKFETTSAGVTVTGKVTANTGGGYDSIKIASNFTADANKQAGITTENYAGNSVSIMQYATHSSANTVYYGSADGAHSGIQNHRFYVNADINTPGSGHTEALHIASNTSATFAGNVVVNSSNSTGVNLKVGGESGNGIKSQYVFSGSSQRNWQIGMATHATQTLSITPSSAAGNTTFTTPILNLDGSNNNATFAGTITTTGTLTTNTGHVNVDSGYSFQWGDTHERIEQSDGKIEFFANNTQQMTLSGANLGIGTDSPGEKLTVSGTTSHTTAKVLTTTGNANLRVSTDNSDFAIIGQGASNRFDIYDANASSTRFSINSSGDANFAGDLEATGIYVGATNTSFDLYNNGTTYLNGAVTVDHNLNITSNGYIYVNTGGAEPGASQVGVRITGTQGQAFWNSANSGTTGYNHFNFYNANGAVGSIVTNGSATAFNTSSDYRLKEDLKDFDGLDKVSKIPVYDFKWKVDDSRSYGVMAHELQEVVPNAVSGEKDAEEMQGVDYSKIVPLLIKSIQELEARVKTLENK